MAKRQGKELTGNNLLTIIQINSPVTKCSLSPSWLSPMAKLNVLITQFPELVLFVHISFQLSLYSFSHSVTWPASLLSYITEQVCSSSKIAILSTMYSGQQHSLQTTSHGNPSNYQQQEMGSHSIILWVKYQSPLKPLSQSNYSIFIFLSCLQSPFSPYPGWGNTPSSVQGLLLALYTEINSSQPVWSVRDRNQVSYMQSKYLRSCNLSSTKTGFLILVYSYWT